ncbi:MAG: prepilin-type N-terminal cleavage/methylation domain-containing protein [Actinomycetota bacterium]
MSTVSKDTTKNREIGVTLVELMVTMMLMSIAALVLLALLNAALGIMREVQARSEADGEAQLTISTLAWEIRSARSLDSSQPIIETALPVEIVLYRGGTLEGAPTRYRYYQSGAKLLKVYETAQAGGPPWVFTGVTTVAEIGRYIVNDSSTPIFSYFDGNGVEITGQTAAERAKIRLVRINIRCDVDISKPPPPANVTREVSLRNYE